jgi:hypothetical protein
MTARFCSMLSHYTTTEGSGSADGDPDGTRAHAILATNGSNRASRRDGHGEAGEAAPSPQRCANAALARRTRGPDATCA